MTYLTQLRHDIKKEFLDEKIRAKFYNAKCADYKKIKDLNELRAEIDSLPINKLTITESNKYFKTAWISKDGQSFVVTYKGYIISNIPFSKMREVFLDILCDIFKKYLPLIKYYEELDDSEKLLIELYDPNE